MDQLRRATAKEKSETWIFPVSSRHDVYIDRTRNNKGSRRKQEVQVILEEWTRNKSRSESFSRLWTVRYWSTASSPNTSQYAYLTGFIYFLSMLSH